MSNTLPVIPIVTMEDEAYMVGRRYVQLYAKKIFYKIVNQYSGKSITNSEIKQIIKYKNDISDINTFVRFLVKEELITKVYVETGRKAVSSGRYYMETTERGKALLNQ